MTGDITILDQIPFLADLSEDDKKRVYEVMTEVKYLAEAAVFREGEAGDKMYIIQEGEVEVEEGITLKKGDFFGEMALVNEMPRSATVRAKTDLHLLVLDKNNFYALMQETPGIAEHISKVLMERLES